MCCRALGRSQPPFFPLLFLQEKPRNHVDLRGRIDSKGVRYGKVIPYKYEAFGAVCLRFPH